MTFVNLQGSIVLLHDNHKYNTCNRIWYVELWISCERFWTVSQTKWWKKKNIESWTKTKVTCKKHLRLCKKNVIYNGMRSAFLFSCYRRNVIKILSYSFSQLICTWFISFSLPSPILFGCRIINISLNMFVLPNLSALGNNAKWAMLWQSYIYLEEILKSRKHLS